MEHFAGLDVSVKETSVCIVDDTGKIVREVKVASEPEALFRLVFEPHDGRAFSADSEEKREPVSDIQAAKMERSGQSESA